MKNFLELSKLLESINYSINVNMSLNSISFTIYSADNSVVFNKNYYPMSIANTSLGDIEASIVNDVDKESNLHVYVLDTRVEVLRSILRTYKKLEIISGEGDHDYSSICKNATEELESLLQRRREIINSNSVEN